MTTAEYPRTMATSKNFRTSDGVSSTRENDPLGVYQIPLLLVRTPGVVKISFAPVKIYRSKARKSIIGTCH